jgi:hypothetical protein
LALSACAASVPPPPERIDLHAPRQSTLQPCADPVAIEALVAAAGDPVEQERLWRADHRNLANCQWQHAALIAWARGVLSTFGAIK